MINLLPPKEKESLRLEIKKRLFLILWFLFLFFLVCFILILLSIKFYLDGKVESQIIIIERAQNQQEKSELENIRKKLDSFNKILEKLDSFYGKRLYFSQTFENVLNLLPKDSYLNNISVNSLADKAGVSEIQVTLSGFISSRESLFNFKKILEEENWIKEVSFPASNWTKPNNINFSATFKIELFYES